MQTPRTIQWVGDSTSGFVRLIDQTLLPATLEYRDCRSVEEVWEAIRSLRVRGAPAIGIAAAMGVVLGLQKHANAHRADFFARLDEVCAYLRTSRPTAVNLFWALERMHRHAGHLGDRRPKELLDGLLKEALAIEEEDRRMCRAIGSHRSVGIGFTQEMIRPTSMALPFADPACENRTWRAEMAAMNGRSSRGCRLVSPGFCLAY